MRRALLESELGVTPSAATRAAYAALLPREAPGNGEPVAGPPPLVGRTAERRAWCAKQGAVVAEARCHAAEGPLVYGPVTAWLRSGALRPRLAQLDRESRSELARMLPEHTAARRVRFCGARARKRSPGQAFPRTSGGAAPQPAPSIRATISST